jgi:hypothetical protein
VSKYLTLRYWGYGYDGRYGKCIGFKNRQGGWAMLMEDGSEHFMGKWTWITKCSAIPLLALCGDPWKLLTTSSSKCSATSTTAGSNSTGSPRRTCREAR